MPRAEIWLRDTTTFGGSGWRARALVNRLTAGDFWLRPVEACWLQRFLEGQL
jgi:hypothetical protein